MAPLNDLPNEGGPATPARRRRRRGQSQRRRSRVRVAAPAAPVVDATVVDATPHPAGLVPLSEIAPAIAAISMSRRRFLGFGLAVLGGLGGAFGLSRLFPVFEEPESAVRPIVPAYDPARKAWTFVVDTTGRADVASFKVIRTTHELFATAVKNALPRMRFIPAEVGDRKVRQLVQQPFSFAIVK